MINLAYAVDSRGLMIRLTGRPDTIHLGRILRELAEMTAGIPIPTDHPVQWSVASHARNCLLAAQAYDAASRLEAHMQLCPQPGDPSPNMVGNGGW